MQPLQSGNSHCMFGYEEMWPERLCGHLLSDMMTVIMHRLIDDIR